MKKIFLFLISLFATANAFAAPFLLSNFYIDGFGGINFAHSYKEDGMQFDFNSGYALGGALGYRFSRFRLEGEVAYRANTCQLAIKNAQFSASGSAEKVTALLNGVIEIPLLKNTLIPYCGVGLGESWENLTTDEDVSILDMALVSINRYGPVAQAIGGLTFYTGRKIQVSVEYHYLDGPHLSGNHTIDLKLKRYF